LSDKVRTERFLVRSPRVWAIALPFIAIVTLVVALTFLFALCLAWMVGTVLLVAVPGVRHQII
jgi:hypothetical protein